MLKTLLGVHPIQVRDTATSWSDSGAFFFSQTLSNLLLSSQVHFTLSHASWWSLGYLALALLSFILVILIVEVQLARREETI